MNESFMNYFSHNFDTIVTMKTTNYCIITTTIDDKNIADQISTILLQNNLVACVQSHSIQSKYRWNGTVETSEEIFLQMKTKASLFEEVKAHIEALHSYEVPEIIMTPILDGNDDYLKWIDKETR
jgi:periplasmic divalent cation tolerance protein